jgi:hypothetical protein
VIKIADVLYYSVSCAGLIMSLTAFCTFIRISIESSSKELPSHRFVGRQLLVAAILFFMMAAINISLGIIAE